MPLVSIVIPAFNEAETLPLFYAELVAALDPLQPRATFEFIFVNNGSSDATLGLLSALREKDPRIQILTLSRNFGYQPALTAGLRFAQGDAVACVDSDGEDPPVILAKFVERWLEGDADVVYGIRGRRPESELMQLARRAYYRVTRALADHEIILDMAEFCLLDRRVCDAVLTTNSTFPFIRGQVGYVGFRRIGIRYDRAVRLGGHSHYNLIRAFKFGLGGILSSSTFPLRLLAYGGAVLVPLGVVGLLAILVQQVLAHQLALTTIVMLAVMFLLLWVVFALGVLAVYVARIYKDQVGLPLFVIDKTRSVIDESRT